MLIQLPALKFILFMSKLFSIVTTFAFDNCSTRNSDKWHCSGGCILIPTLSVSQSLTLFSIMWSLLNNSKIPAKGMKHFVTVWTIPVPITQHKWETSTLYNITPYSNTMHTACFLNNEVLVFTFSLWVFSCKTTEEQED